MYNGNSLRSAFPGFHPGDIPKLICFIDEIKATNSFFIPSTGETWNVGEALASPGGLKFNLAGIWLSAVLGFFDQPLPGGEFGTPQDWVEHFDALVFAFEHWGDDYVFTAVFTDGSSNWTSADLPPGYTCS